jgi:hypothetical protein
MAVILWVGSVGRVVAGAVEHEAFRAEATLAMLCVVLVPWWALQLLFETASRRRGRRKRQEIEPTVPNRVVRLADRRRILTKS